LNSGINNISKDPGAGADAKNNYKRNMAEPK